MSQSLHNACDTSNRPCLQLFEERLSLQTQAECQLQPSFRCLALLWPGARWHASRQSQQPAGHLQVSKRETGQCVVLLSLPKALTCQAGLTSEPWAVNLSCCHLHPSAQPALSNPARPGQLDRYSSLHCHAMLHWQQPEVESSRNSSQGPADKHLQKRR